MSIYKPGRPSRQEPPNTEGEYRWVNKDTKDIDYIGETSDLDRRKAEHERSEKPVSSDTHHFEWQKADGRSTSNTRRDHEREKIKEHNPPLNQRAGGGGRKAK